MASLHERFVRLRKVFGALGPAVVMHARSLPAAFVAKRTTASSRSATPIAPPILARLYWRKLGGLPADGDCVCCTAVTEVVCRKSPCIPTNVAISVVFVFASNRVNVAASWVMASVNVAY